MAPRTRRTTKRRPVARPQRYSRQNRRSDEVRNIPDNLFEKAVERFGDQPQTQDLEETHEDKEHEQPEDTARNPAFDLESLGLFFTDQPAGDSVVEFRAFEPPPNKGGGDQGDEPSDDQDGERKHELTEVCGDQFLGVVHDLLHLLLLLGPSEAGNGDEQTQRLGHDARRSDSKSQ